jgi:hypothetical protein
MLIGSGLQALATSGKFKPVALGQIRTAGNSDRPLRRGVAIVLRLLTAGVITIGQVEAAALVSGGAPGESDDGGAQLEPGQAATSVAEKLFALAPRTCRWPCGELGDPESFHFCGRPAARAPYCDFHHARAHLPRIVRPRAPKPHPVDLSTVPRAAPELAPVPPVEALDQGDAVILDRARDRCEVELVD